MAGRSPALQAEVQVMDRIERAMRGIEDLSPAGQARVRSWVAEVYSVPAEPARPEEPAP